jgi:serine O-acetyltransferase
MIDLDIIGEDVRRLNGQATAPGHARLWFQILGLAWRQPLFFRILVLRHYQWSKRKGLPNLPLMKIANFRLNAYVEINTLAIGPGLRIYHGDGIVIASGAVIGRGMTIEHQVTIGNRIGHEGELGCPTIGDNVFIGVGAKVLGAIHIGNNVRIGANAVVLHDVPDNATVVGVPSKVVRFASMCPAEVDVETD